MGCIRQCISICFLLFVTQWIQTSSNFPFNDPTLPWNTRVDDLVSRLTISEIADQLSHGGRVTHAPPIERLGIKPYVWGSECLRGDVKAGAATSFPQALGLAASFSQEVIFNVSRATGLEVRAKFNNYSARHYYGLHTSASCWSPVVNIMRDPRWGRNQETYGEDPYLTSYMAKWFVKGLQGDNTRYVLANAGCKHIDVYGGPDNIPISRKDFNAKVTDSDWRMTFLPAFKSCVDAGTYSFMCSHNSINGIPACANHKLLTDILRKEWGFMGYVVSDEGAIMNVMTYHNYTHAITDTAALALKAGCNLEDGKPNNTVYTHLPQALKQGKISEDTIRQSVKPLFYTRMRLGLFDPPRMNPYSKLDPKKLVQSVEHRELAITSAMKTFVLLKNAESFLPLKPGQKVDKLAIVGPMADNINGIFGSYAPEPDPKYVVTPRQGLSVIGKTVKYAAGCPSTTCTDYIRHGQVELKQAVQGSDLVIVCLGTGANIEGESNDRTDIELPGQQSALLHDVVKYSAGKPVILLLFNGGPLNASYAVHNAHIHVIMECFFPAQGAGEALRRVFYNEGVDSNPASRLPATWPISIEQVPPITNYTMIGRTYRYWQGDVLFPFGYGLSYTVFRYKDLVLSSREIPDKPGGSFHLSVSVCNDGVYDGSDVIQVYVTWPDLDLLPSIPKLQLVAFIRCPDIQSGSCTRVKLAVFLKTLQVWNPKQEVMQVLKGSYMVYVGGQQPATKIKVPSNILKTSLIIT